MESIIKVAASEELLKIYFFKLFSRKEQLPISFFESEIRSIIKQVPLKFMTSKELFSCCEIKRSRLESGYEEDLTPDNDFEEYESTHEGFEKYLPEIFYYFSENEILDGTIENHPFLYTKITPLENTTIIAAEIGYSGIGIDLLDESGKVLDSFYPNLYHDGNLSINVLSEKLILVKQTDNHFGDSYELYAYNENRLERFYEIDNKTQILEYIVLKGCPGVFIFAAENLRDDKEVVLATVSRNGLLFRYCSEKFKDDKDVFLSAVSQKGCCILTYASTRLKDDFDVVVAAVSNDGFELKDASTRLKDNDEVINHAIKSKLMSIRYASNRLKIKHGYNNKYNDF